MLDIEVAEHPKGLSLIDDKTFLYYPDLLSVVSAQLKLKQQHKFTADDSLDAPLTRFNQHKANFEKSSDELLSLMCFTTSHVSFTLPPHSHSHHHNDGVTFPIYIRRNLLREERVVGGGDGGGGGAGRAMEGRERDFPWWAWPVASVSIAQ
jgi:hypothetical protein